MPMRAIFASVILAALTLGGVAFAQTDVNALRASGQVGEQSDGYLGFVNGRVTGDLKPAVDQVNIQRRAAYTQLSERHGVTVALAGERAACTIIAERVEPGQWYSPAPGDWRQRGAGAPELPRICAATGN